MNCVILTRDEYDAFTIDDFRRELAALSPGVCTIDFRNVRYLDSTCLTELIRVLKALRNDNPASSIDILNLQDGPRQIFRLTALDTLFTVPAPSS
jgi:anti-anti-sigma regulatory factor